jgi:hypothetical protein
MCICVGRVFGEASELLGAFASARSPGETTVCDSRRPLGVVGACGREGLRDEEEDILGVRSLRASNASNAYVFNTVDAECEKNVLFCGSMLGSRK